MIIFGFCIILFKLRMISVGTELSTFQFVCDILAVNVAFKYNTLETLTDGNYDLCNNLLVKTMYHTLNIR